MSGVALLLLCPAQGGALQPKASPRDLESRQVDVTILARGPSLTSSTGDMDSYLAVISGGRHAVPVTARLVRYYPFFQDALSEEKMAAGRAFHLRLSYPPYCGMQAKAFAVQRAFDAEAVGKLQEASG